jgi:hypothetical protein
MKIAEYRQMMAYLSRPKFNSGGSVGSFVKPKKKPKEEAEKVNKARKEKNFEKVKGALENPKEVKEMIDKPKRGLVDEPGSYAGAKGKGIQLTKKEIKILKDNLTKQEFAQLDFDRTGVQAGQKNYGIGQRDNRNLFKKVRALIEPGTDLTAQFGQLYSNEKARSYIIKEANKGKSNQEIIEGLKKFKLNTSINSNRISSLIAKLPEVKEEFKRVPSTGRTVGFQAERAKKVMDIVNNSIKNKVPIPSLSEIARDLGFDTYGEVGKIIQKEKGEKFYKKFFKNMQDKQKERILKLANNGKVVQALGDGTILNEKMTKYVAKVLGTNVQTAGSALFDLKEAYAGNKTYIKPNELPKIRATKGFNLIAREAAKDPFNNPYWNKVRVSRESKVSKAIGEGKNVLDAARRKITKAAKPVFEKLGLAKKGVSVATDELANISTSAQYGGEGYSVYQQVLTKTGDKTKDDFNLQKAKQLDRKLVNIRKKIVQGIATPDDIKDYNTSVKKIVSQINANVPAGAKRLEAITIVPGGNPLKTVSGINKLKSDNPTAYQNIIDDAKRYNVSYNIPKSVESIYTMGDKPTIQKRIMDSLKKGFNEFDEKKLIQTIKNKTPRQIKQIFKAIPRVADVSQDDVVRFASANNIMTDATFVDQDPIQKSGRSMLDFIKDNPITSGVTAAAAISPFQLGRKIIGTGLRTIGTPTLLAREIFKQIPEADYSQFGSRFFPEATAAFAKDAVRLGQGLAKQAGKGIRSLGNVPFVRRTAPFVRQAAPFVRKGVQTLAGARLPFAPRLIFKGARILNPIGQLALLGEGAYALGKAGVAERQRIKAMSPEERELFDAQQESISEFAAAGGGIAKLAGKSSGPAPESGPTPQGLDFLMKRGR